ncbi:MAG: glycoside hydrolase family 2, partial [Pseudopedobacter saltans]
LNSNGSIEDSSSVNFGFRNIHFDRENGFFLNGKSVKIKGVCLHHDAGALGAVVNVRAIERQLQILKDMGCNAIRTSHNAPAPELLDLCDKMGFLVMDEVFDMWAKKKNKFDYHLDFPQWHKQDLQDQILRDRNHPSVFMWSIGNEIREQFDSSGTRLTKELVRLTKEIDTSRPITSALTEMDTTKNFIYQAKDLDVLGWNYNEKMYSDFLKKYPGQKFIASETVSALESRGHYDTPGDTTMFWPSNSKEKYVVNGNKDFTVSAYDDVAAYWGSSHETTWKIIKKYPFLSGTFVWTGFDYLGEPTPYPFPARSSYFGIVDLAGFPKDVYYMYQSEWSDKNVLHLLPHWNWKPGKIVNVWAYYNNADEVELYLNGKSLGVRKKQGDDLHVTWKVPFESGTLKAISRRDGKTVLTKEIKTAGKPAKILLSADRDNISSNSNDLSYVTVQVVDKDGNIVPNADNEISFSITGTGSIAGTDNGYQADTTSLKRPIRKAFNGKCLVIIQSNNKQGTILLKATSPHLNTTTITINSKK